MDPNIELSSVEQIIKIDNLESEYGKKIVQIEFNDIDVLLTMRYDSADDEKRIVDMEFDNNKSMSLDIY